MSTELLRTLGYIAVMAGVTYAVRALPLLLFRREIKSVFIRSFLGYIPYAVLGAMTVPAIFYATSCLPSAIAGLVVAVFLAYQERSLPVVAAVACVVAFVVERLLGI